MSRSNIIITGLISAIAVISVGFMAAHYLQARERTATLVTLITPSEGANIQVNGVGVAQGEITLKPGGYNIEVSAEGFEPQTRSVVLGAGDVARIAVALQPNSQVTSGYYKKNGAEASKAEAIAGQTSQARAASKIARLPIIRNLPKADDGNYRIDYGLSKERPDDPSALAVIITYYTKSGRQSAINWLKYRGYDQSNTEIILKGFEVSS